MDHAPQVDIDGPLPVGEGRVEERAANPDSCIVDDDRGHAMFALDAGREVVHRAGVGHVDPEWVNKRCLIGGGFRRREIDVGG